MILSFRNFKFNAETIFNNIQVNDVAEFNDVTMIILTVMTSEAVRFEELQTCLSAVLDGLEGFSLDKFAEEMVSSFCEYFGLDMPAIPKLIFTGFIDDGDQEYDYQTFIDTLREMSQDSDTSPVEIYFNLKYEKADDAEDAEEQIIGSPKMKIDFENSMYIHEICPGNAQDGFQDWEEIGTPNYPRIFLELRDFEFTIDAIINAVKVNEKADFLDETMIVLTIMTSEAIRFEEVQTCFSTVLGGKEGFSLMKFLEPLLYNFGDVFGIEIPELTDFVSQLVQDSDPVSTIWSWFGSLFGWWLKK